MHISSIFVCLTLLSSSALASSTSSEKASSPAPKRARHTGPLSTDENIALAALLSLTQSDKQTNSSSSSQVTLMPQFAHNINISSSSNAAVKPTTAVNTPLPALSAEAAEVLESWIRAIKSNSFIGYQTKKAKKSTIKGIICHLKAAISEMDKPFSPYYLKLALRRLPNLSSYVNIDEFVDSSVIKESNKLPDIVADTPEDRDNFRRFLDAIYMNNLHVLPQRPISKQALQDNIQHVESALRMNLRDFNTRKFFHFLEIFPELKKLPLTSEVFKEVRFFDWENLAKIMRPAEVQLPTLSGNDYNNLDSILHNIKFCDFDRLRRAWIDPETLNAFTQHLRQGIKELGSSYPREYLKLALNSVKSVRTNLNVSEIIDNAIPANEENSVTMVGNVEERKILTSLINSIYLRDFAAISQHPQLSKETLEANSKTIKRALVVFLKALKNEDYFRLLDAYPLLRQLKVTREAYYDEFPYDHSGLARITAPKN